MPTLNTHGKRYGNTRKWRNVKGAGILKLVTHLLNAISRWAFPLILLGIPLFGIIRGVKVYNCFIEGAKEGFGLALRLLPYLVAIFSVLAVFKASGMLTFITSIIGPLLAHMGIPPEMIPLFMIRPLSGSGALAVSGDIMRTAGPDSLIGKMAAAVQGSTDTTFYIITLYFGCIKIRNTRHVLLVALIGDIAGFFTAVAVSKALFGK